MTGASTTEPMTRRELALERLRTGVRRMIEGDPPPAPEPRPRRAPAVTPHRLTDGLAQFATLNRQPERPPLTLGPERGALLEGLSVDKGTTIPVPSQLLADRTLPQPVTGPIRGAEAIIAKLATWGVRVELHRGQLITSTRGGVLPPGEAAGIITVARPLLEAHLKGSPLPCQVASHAQPTDAVTVTWPSLFGACAECMASER
jgi:hypothetical protein